MPSLINAAKTHLSWRRLFFAGVIILVTLLLLLPWWRNHTILNDFYDYGLVMAGAGRIELGERPYVDFLTPIQTLHFRLAVLAESVFGPHYLSLTYANAVFIAGSFAGMAGLLYRRLGTVTAVTVAAAVVSASSGQHNIVWHNALGVAWTTGVLWLTARPGGVRLASFAFVLICVLLWLGGMTKLTYQVAALAFAVLFALRDAALEQTGWLKTSVAIAAYGLAGVVAPVLTELVYTGASFHQWLYNVVELPGSREEMLKAIFTKAFFLQPFHNHYHPMFLPFVGTWATGLIVVTAGLAWRTRPPVHPWRAAVLLLCTAIGAWLCGAVLLTTNIEIGYMAGAAWLTFAVALALSSSVNAAGLVAKPTRIALGLAAVILLGASWISAWQGIRSLWAATPLERGKLVSADGLAARYDYLHGTQITELMRLSLEAFDLRQQGLHDGGFKPSAFYFTNASEWMVRAFPEARHRGLPLWLHYGTSYGWTESFDINHRLIEQKDIRVVISMEAWNYWANQTDWYLAKFYQRDHFGPLLNVYTAKVQNGFDEQDPIAFAQETNSSANLHDLIFSGAATGLHPRTGGNIWGASASFTADIKSPVHHIRGEWVFRRASLNDSVDGVASWRLFSIASDGTKKLIHEARCILAPHEKEVTAPFSFQTGDRPVVLAVELPPDNALEGGFHQLQTDYAVASDAKIPPFLTAPASQGKSIQALSAKALFVSPSMQHTLLRGTALAISPDDMPTGPELMVHTPGEIWFPLDDPSLKELTGEFGLRPGAWIDPHALEGIKAQVVFFRPGKLQVLFEQAIRPKSTPADRVPHHFVAPLPGQTGWIGLIFTSLNPPANANGQSWWRRVELH